MEHCSAKAVWGSVLQTSTKRWFCTEGREFNPRRLRHAKGLSQDDLAYEAEVSRSYLSQLGRVLINSVLQARLAECPLHSNSDRIAASPRNVAMCQTLHFALQEKQQPFLACC
jgi:hypothetical protein